MYSMQKMKQKANMHLHCSRALGLTQVFSKDGNMKNGFAINPWSIVIVCLYRDGYMMRQRKTNFFCHGEQYPRREAFPFQRGRLCFPAMYMPASPTNADRWSGVFPPSFAIIRGFFNGPNRYWEIDYKLSLVRHMFFKD